MPRTRSADRSLGSRVSPKVRAILPISLVGALLGCAPRTTSPPASPPPAIAPRPLAPMTCPDPAGCAAPIEEGPRFEAPGDGEAPPTIVATEADCAGVGLAMAAFELGNYAAADALAAASAQHEARCAELRLDQEARTCVFEAPDTASAAYCAPALVPTVTIEIVEPAACTAVFDTIRAQMTKRSRIDVQRRWWTPREAAYLASCRTDRWTRQIATCFQATYPSGCSYQAPAPLRTKLLALEAREAQREREALARWNAAYAAPRKHPTVKLALVSRRGCARILRAVDKRLAALPAHHWEPTWWKPRRAALAASCRRDRWTREFGACVAELPANGCITLAPSLLQQKLYAAINRPAPPPPRPRPRPRR